jgi:ABC-type multidrug transport system fused ATPase/permease subunit
MEPYFSYVIAAITTILVIISIMGAMGARQVNQVATKIGDDADRQEVFDQFSEQLYKYYAQALAQAKLSFWFSMIFASIGFFVIIMSGIDYAHDGSAVIFKLASGTIVEAISALFYVQANKTQKSMLAFFEKLRLDKRYMDAMRYSKEISDDSLKSQTISKVVLGLSGVSVFSEGDSNEK